MSLRGARIAEKKKPLRPELSNFSVGKEKWIKELIIKQKKIL
tara:strand:- start:320 stop:445 length:126 start_codon:yes stop_codon:yes gene_type:complete